MYVLTIGDDIITSHKQYSTEVRLLHLLRHSGEKVTDVKLLRPRTALIAVIRERRRVKSEEENPALPGSNLQSEAACYSSNEVILLSKMAAATKTLAGLSKAVRELRIHLCQRSQSSQGVR